MAAEIHTQGTVVNPTANQEIATKKYVDDQDAAADAHISADGSSHSFINQDVTTTGTPTFGITTLADASTLVTSAAPTADAEIANKKYVDDNITPHTPEGTAIKSTGEGGASKFLREDGDGTCSWQTTAGATTKSRNQMFPAAMMYSADAAVLVDANYAMRTFTDATTNTAYATWVVPQDWSSGLIFQIYWKAAAASGNAVWKISANWAPSGSDKELRAEDSGEITSAINGADKVNYKLDIFTFTSAQKGDIVAIKLERIGASASDTVNADIELIGLGIQYTSEQ